MLIFFALFPTIALFHKGHRIIQLVRGLRISLIQPSQSRASFISTSRKVLEQLVLETISKHMKDYSMGLRRGSHA